jgi:SAM-dependent methyltransferase
LFESRLIEGEAWEGWLHEVRRLEFESLLASVPLGRVARVLELGSGDGLQLGLLRRRFERVFAIDPFRAPAGRSGFVFARAEALPFPDGYFDLVCSSNVLEHLQDRRRAMGEAVRVLRPGGYMAHAVPSRVWKASSLLLRPLCYGMHMAGKWSLLRRQRPAPEKALGAGIVTRPSLGGLLNRCFRPEIHGTFASHRAEFRAYGEKPWRQVLTHPRIERVAEVPLITYSPFGLLRGRLMGGRLWLGRHGLGSVHGFILRKIPDSETS